MEIEDVEPTYKLPDRACSPSLLVNAPSTSSSFFNAPPPNPVEVLPKGKIKKKDEKLENVERDEAEDEGDDDDLQIISSDEEEVPMDIGCVKKEEPVDYVDIDEDGGDEIEEIQVLEITTMDKATVMERRRKKREFWAEKKRISKMNAAGLGESSSSAPSRPPPPPPPSSQSGRSSPSSTTRTMPPPPPPPSLSSLSQGPPSPPSFPTSTTPSPPPPPTINDPSPTAPTVVSAGGAHFSFNIASELALTIRVGENGLPIIISSVKNATSTASNPPQPPSTSHSPPSSRTTLDCQTGDSLLNGEPVTRPNIDLSKSQGSSPPPSHSSPPSTRIKIPVISPTTYPGPSTSTATTSTSTSAATEKEIPTKRPARRSHSRSSSRSRSPHKSRRRHSSHRHSSSNRHRSRDDSNLPRKEHIPSPPINPLFHDASSLIRLIKGCSKCERDFPSRGEGVDHHRKEHNQKHCPVCFITISKKRNIFKDHFTKYHAIDDSEMGQCPFCTKEYNIDGIYNHIGKVHLTPTENSRSFSNSPSPPPPTLTRQPNPNPTTTTPVPKASPPTYINRPGPKSKKGPTPPEESPPITTEPRPTSPTAPNIISRGVPTASANNISVRRKDPLGPPRPVGVRPPPPSMGRKNNMETCENNNRSNEPSPSSSSSSSQTVILQPPKNSIGSFTIPKKHTSTIRPTCPPSPPSPPQSRPAADSDTPQNMHGELKLSSIHKGRLLIIYQQSMGIPTVEMMKKFAEECGVPFKLINDWFVKKHMEEMQKKAGTCRRSRKPPECR